MKKYITLPNVIIFLWGPLYIAISVLYPDYTRYYLYLSIILIIPMMIRNLIIQRREDKENDTKQLKSSIYSILISAVILGVLFYATKQIHL